MSYQRQQYSTINDVQHCQNDNKWLQAGSQQQSLMRLPTTSVETGLCSQYFLMNNNKIYTNQKHTPAHLQLEFELADDRLKSCTPPQPLTLSGTRYIFIFIQI